MERPVFKQSSPVIFAQQFSFLSKKFFSLSDSCPVTSQKISRRLYTLGLKDEFEKVQNSAARFVTRNYTREEGNMTGIIQQLKWEPY